jgi:ADP-heptose:LPS heptosyltransferase
VTHTLVVRSDNAGDVLLAGPAIRAVASGSDRVTVLAGPHGSAAARLLPGVDEVMEWLCPWIDYGGRPLEARDVRELIEELARRRFDGALVLTSFHQSALPMALLLRMAAIPWVGAISEDFPGSLLDLRHRVEEGLPEPERALSLAVAAGFSLPASDHGALHVLRPLPDVSHLVPESPFVVLHPGTSVPARAWPVERFAETAQLLTRLGHCVVVTGSPGEKDLTARVAAAGTGAVDLGGLTDLAELAAVLEAAQGLVAGNTGPAHLAAAVGTPVVSLFAPTVSRTAWAPYRVPTVLLGDQDAVCRDTRATVCPFEGHPCLVVVQPSDVLGALEQLGALTRQETVGSVRQEKP